MQFNIIFKTIFEYIHKKFSFVDTNTFCKYRKKLLASPCVHLVYNRGDYESMCENLKDIEWNNIFDHNHPIDLQWSKIPNLIKNLKDKYVPNKIIRYRNKVKHLSRENRKAFENDLAIKAKTKNKAIWKYINARLKINKEINEIHT